MEAADRVRFRELMQALSATFRVEPSPALFEGYWLGLRSMSVDAFETAVAKALATSRFMPAPSELRELGGHLSPSAMALHGWNAVTQAIREHGAYESVSFDDPTINATIRSLGGWQRICGLESEELEKWTRKEFAATYAQLAAFGVHGGQGAPLPGIHEANNRANGHPVEAPKQIENHVSAVKLLPAKGSE